MDTYDPDTAPDPGAWLELDEGARLLLVGDYHEQASDELPNVQIHAAIHVIVENQLARALRRVGVSFTGLRGLLCTKCMRVRAGLANLNHPRYMLTDVSSAARSSVCGSICTAPASAVIHTSPS